MVTVTTRTVHQAVENRLLDRGVRYTTARRAVVGVLAGNAGPLSAAELSEVIGAGVPLSSLYRSLNVLEGAGVVAPHLGAKGLTRYELAEWLIGHHHHLICLECGSVDDVAVPSHYERQVEAIIAGIGEMASFAPSGHAIEIEGRCARCR
jgi:Fur family ferric uptake transcriptional regulator